MSDSHGVIAPGYSLYPYQRQVSHDLLDQLIGLKKSRPNGGRVIAHLPTGAGKTRIACHVASALLNQASAEGKLVIWLASSEELCDQAAESLETAWSHLGNRAVPLHRFWGTHQFELGSATEGFLVAGLAKLYAAYRRETGFLTLIASKAAGIVFDEAHQAIADTYQEMTDSLATYDAPLLGLTATPGRTYEVGTEDHDLSLMFHEQKVDIDPRGHPDPVTFLIKQEYLAEPTFSPVNVTMTTTVREPTSGRDYDDASLEALGRDRVWREQVTHLVLKALERHRRVMVFCPSVRCSDQVANVLSQRGVRAASIVADTDSDQRHEIISAFRSSAHEPMVLLNYGVLTAGFDAPRTSCVIVARPTTSLVLYSQMIGRAMRGLRSGGNRRCQIYTVVDTKLHGFGSVVEAHANWEALWRRPPSN